MRFLCSILAAVIVIGSGLRVRADLSDGIDALVHDSLITYYDVENATLAARDDLRRQYASQPDVYEKKVSEAAKENLEQLIERQLILRDFETAGYQLPESIIDEQLNQYIKERYGDRVTLTKTLQQQGITFEKFRQQYKDRFIIEQMRYQKVSKEIIISPHKVETYYLEHTNDFAVEDQVKLRMIVLNKPASGDTNETRKLADEILGKLNEGASFADMASVYSQGSQAKQGGDWGWVEKSVLRKELADVAFSMKAGEKSGVIETPEADYIMLVEDKRVQHVKPLNDVRAEIETTLLAKERARLQQQWIEKLRKKTFVSYF